MLDLRKLRSRSAMALRRSASYGSCSGLRLRTERALLR